MANKNSFLGTGQLPKFAEDMFKIEGLDYYLGYVSLLRDNSITKTTTPSYFKRLRCGF